jgi:hypothetical protein
VIASQFSITIELDLVRRATHYMHRNARYGQTPWRIATKVFNKAATIVAHRLSLPTPSIQLRITPLRNGIANQAGVFRREMLTGWPKGE